MTGGIVSILKKLAEGITVAMVAMLFLSVLTQVFTRYVLGAPVNWTIEVASILWLWIIFWTGSLLIPDADQIRIDILYSASPPKLRKLFSAFTSLMILVAFAIAFWPTVEFVDFMKISSSPMLRIGFNTVFAIFLLFMVSMIVRSALVLIKLMRGKSAEDSLI